jgi:hypothetical protein
MHHPNKGRVLAIVVPLLAALVTAGAARAQGTAEKSKVDAFEKQLAKRGFGWQAGQAWFPPILDMCCKCQLPSCYANNASTRYGFFALPPAPGQSPSVPNPYSEWFTQDGELPPGWSFAWRLRPDEAVVYIAKTPPKVEYFGFTVYLYDRYVAAMGPEPDCTYKDGDGNTQHRAQPPSAQNRFPVFASLGDTINQQTIDLAGGRQDPYQKNVVVVAAADQKILRQVESALVAAGYPAKSINALPVPPALVRLGTDSQNDSAMVLMRVSPGAGNDVDYYYSQPMTILRVTPTTPAPVPQLDPIALPRLRIRGTGKTEAYLEAQVDALGQSIVAYYAGLGYKAAPVKMAALPDGFNCITNMQNCLADNRDTIYISPAYDIISSAVLPEQPSLVLGPNDFLVAYGVQHPSVKKALYSNISIMGWNKRAAPAVVTNQDMAGSAQEYVPGADPALYAYQIARMSGCLTQHCVALGPDCGSGIALDEPVAPIFRAYLEPGTKVGPSRGEVVLDRVLKFSPME